MSEQAPNTCPQCGAAAYVGFNTVECTWSKCEHFHEETAVQHQLSEMLDEEEPTQPNVKVTSSKNTGFGTPLVFGNLSGASGGGSALDDWAALLGLAREHDESDDSLQDRILKVFGKGTP